MEEQLEVTIIRALRSKKGKSYITYLISDNESEYFKGYVDITCEYDSIMPFDSLKSEIFGKKLNAVCRWKQDRFDTSKASRYIINVSNEKGEILW